MILARRPDRAPRLLLATMLAALALLAVLAANVAAGGASGWDRFMFRQLYSGDWDWAGARSPGQDNRVLEVAVPFLYRLADTRILLLLVAAVLGVLLLRKLVRATAFFAAAVAVTAMAPVLKMIFDRPSPFPMPDDPSFPSGHATGSMAVAAGIVALLGSTRWRWAAFVASAVFLVGIGVAVVADGGHWPSDVLAGWSLSFAWVAMLRAVVGDPLRRSAARSPNVYSAGSRVIPPAGAGSASPV